MPSIADNKNLVKEVLNAGPDHDAILASLQQEIDKHNQIKSDSEEHLRKRRRRRERHEGQASDSDLRFRFKNTGDDSRHRRSRPKHKRSNARPDEAKEAEHPFPREPASPTSHTDDAFLSSLLDALADDEAAAYWESVYSQPIHAFSRPAFRTDKGELEELSDEDYAAWVKQRMWEKQHPEIVMERDRVAQKRREEAEEKERRKREFIRKREREAWTRSSRHKPEDYDYVFDFDTAKNGQSKQQSAPEWNHAWTTYLRAWEQLKNETPSIADPSKILPWPTLPSKPPIRTHIEDFMRNMPLLDGKTRQHVLKAERVRWHPDKIQQRFQGRVDEGTMKVVTGIFQIIDAIWSEELAKKA